jgi:putative DNA primase/helicase
MSKLMSTTGGNVEATQGLNLMLHLSEVGKNLGAVRPLPVLWPDFADKLLRTTYTSETIDAYAAATREERTRIKNVGGYVGGCFSKQKRVKSDFVSAGVISLDFDKDVKLSDVWGNFCILEWAGLVYTTHSHTPGNDRFRLVIPLSRPVNAGEYAALARGIVTRMGSPAVDEGSYQAERVMFWPSTSEGGEFISHYADGDILDPDTVLPEIEASTPQVNKGTKPAPTEPESPWTKPGIVGAFCRTYTAPEAISEFLSDRYERCESRRGNYYTYSGGTTSGGLFVYPSLLHAYSHHSSDPANTGHAVNAFDLVRLHLYGDLDKKARKDKPVTQLPSFMAMREFAIEIPRVKKETEKEQRETAAREFDEFEDTNYTHRNESRGDIICKLLKQVEWVDFRKRAKLKGDVKIPHKVYVIIAIDQLLRLAVSNNWGLCTKDGFIYAYNGSYWQVIDVGDFRQFLGRAAVKMGAPALEVKHHHFKEELYKQFLSEANLPTPEAKQSTLVNLTNGTFEISEAGQKIRDARREDFIKHRLPFAYNPDATCPMFTTFLNEVQPDEASRLVLAEYIGYVFTHGLNTEQILVLYGDGANGKSVFFNIVRALLGPENVCSYSLSDLTRPDSWQRAELGNHLLNYTTELGVKLENSIFKQLVSCEPVGAQRKYHDPFTMTDYAKLMVNANKLPAAAEQTHAFFRRFLIANFNVTIPKERQDPELARKIIANELSGIFNWVLSGLRRLLANKKFTRSAVMERLAEEYRKESDSVAMFADEEGYTPSVREHIPLKEVYEDYAQYCYDNGYCKVSNREMRKRLGSLGYHSEKIMTGIRVYATRKIKQ